MHASCRSPIPKRTTTLTRIFPSPPCMHSSLLLTYHLTARRRSAEIVVEYDEGSGVTSSSSLVPLNSPAAREASAFSFQPLSPTPSEPRQPSGLRNEGTLVRSASERAPPHKVVSASAPVDRTATLRKNSSGQVVLPVAGLEHASGESSDDVDEEPVAPQTTCAQFTLYTKPCTKMCRRFTFVRGHAAATEDE